MLARVIEEPSPERGAVRGIALRQFLITLGDLRGAGYMQNLWEALPRIEQELFNPGLAAFGISSARWYSARSIGVLLDAIAEHGDIDTQEAGYQVVRQTVMGVFRLAFRTMASPERFAAHSQRFFRFYYSEGSMEVSSPSSTSAVVVIEGWPVHHRLLCDLHRGGARALYEVMGCEGVVVTQPRCLGLGHAHCSHHIRWR